MCLRCLARQLADKQQPSPRMNGARSLENHLATFPLGMRRIRNAPKDLRFGKERHFHSLCSCAKTSDLYLGKSWSDGWHRFVS